MSPDPVVWQDCHMHVDREDKTRKKSNEMNSSHKARARSRTLLFLDADDTLWENSIWYQQATQEFADLPALRHLSPTQVATEVDRRDVRGYGEKAFQSALAATYRDLLGQASSTDLAHVLQIGEVSRRELQVLPDVAQTLHSLSRRYRLVVVSKGEPCEQEHKLERSGLRSFFLAVRVVPKKTEAVYRRLQEEFEVRASESWMIGDSVLSDINPAQQAGLGTIYLPNPNTWSRERGSREQPASDRQLTLSGFSDLCLHLSSISNDQKKVPVSA